MTGQLSARSEATTRRTYNRPLDDEGSKFETWPQTVERAQVEHQRRLWADAGGMPDEAELAELRQLGLSRAGLVSGRTLWLGGTRYAYERAASQFNCSGLRLDTVYDMVDAFWLLLNGCGVGGRPRAGTLHGYPQRIPNLEVVPSDRPKEHRGREENQETLPTADNGYTWTIRVGDSGAAWARVLGKMLVSPRGRTDRLVLDVSDVRGPGGRLKGYGWISNGAEPLVKALTAVHHILNRHAGNLLTEEAIGDVFNWCGTILSSRRAAEALVLDSHHPYRKGFSVRKKDYWLNGNTQRRQSNNSLIFWQTPSMDEIADLLYMNLEGGEPGFVNGEAAVRRCPWFDTFNPCLTGDTLVAVADGRNAVPIAQLAEESGGVRRFDVYSARPTNGGRYGGKWKTEITSAVAILTGEKPVGRLRLSNGDSVRLTADHRVALADGTYRKASECVGLRVETFFTKASHGNRRLINTESNALAKQCRMIWERYNGPKPDGYDVDHIESDGGDYLENLQILTRKKHLAKTAVERQGANNPIHRMTDRDGYRRRKAVQTFWANNPRHSGLTDEYLIDLATTLHRDGIKVTLNSLRALDPRVPTSFSKNRFGGSVTNLRAIAAGEIEYIPPTPPAGPCQDEPVPDVRREVVTVVAFEPDGVEPVYDLIVEKNRNFYVITSGDEANNYLDSRGMLVHNCFEIILPSHGFCNLVSLSLPSFGQDFAALERAVYVMARANYRQTCVNLKDDVLQRRWHQTNESLRLCGVSFTGIVQAPWLTDYDIRRLRNSAIAGMYSMADELKKPRPKAGTTVKPEGTRSKISGTVDREVAEGMHRPLGRYIFNWINFSVNDPLVGAMEAAGYRTMENPSDPANVLVRFPVEYRDCRFDLRDGKEVNLEPAVAQLRRYRRWNDLWADHNVSSTVSLSREEVPEVAAWVHRNWGNSYVATSFLQRADPTKTARDLGHPYLPQEVVTEGTFREAQEQTREVDWDQFHTGWHEISDAQECPGGACPTK